MWMVFFGETLGGCHVEMSFLGIYIMDFGHILKHWCIVCKVRCYNRSFFLSSDL